MQRLFDPLWEGAGGPGNPPATWKTSDVTYSYDEYGNRTGETTYKDHGTAYQDGGWNLSPPDFPTDGRTTTTEYDPGHHTFPITVTQPAVNGLSLVEAREYYEVNESDGSGDGLPGQLKRVQDVNNGTDTWYQYDAFGRPTYTWLPGDVTWDKDRAGTVVTYSVPYTSTTPVWAHAKQRDDDGTGSATYLESWKLYDGLGRLIQSQAESEETGTLILTSRAYDVLGQLWKETVPYTATVTSGGYEAPVWSEQANTAYAYDALGRTTVVTNSDGTTVTTAYQGWEQAVVDENGHQKVQRSDAFGRLISVSEYTGAFASPDFDAQPYATTAYAYDVLDNLVAVTDTLSNVTTMEYDMLGRKTAMHDPDMGDWSYSYDALGNLTFQTDALSQTIAFEYDERNRLVAKDYGDDDVADVTYHYDGEPCPGCPTPAGKVFGRRTATWSAGSWAVYDYDDVRGRLSAERRWIAGAPDLPYVTGYSYDAMDRVVTTISPGGEVVTTTYNVQGLPQTLTNADEYEYVEGADYNALGQPEQVWFGGAGLSLTTRYNYDSQNHRLQTLRVGEPGYSGKHLYLTYAYDDVGNVSRITEWRGGEQQRQLFDYDALNRLTSAATSGTGTWGTYDRTYEYDEVGNLTGKSGVTYSYPASGVGSVRPHAVTSTSNGGTFDYDANPTPLRYGDCAAT